MRLDTLGGDRRNFSRKLGENVGKATRVTQLQGDGIAGQPGGQLQRAVGAARDAIGGGKLEEDVDKATRAPQLQGDGIADPPGGQLQKTIGAAGEAIGGGKLEENVGNVTRATQLQGDGIADQPGDQLQKTVGAAGKAIGGGVGPLTQRAKQFARERPFVTAALLGVLSLALINTLRGKTIRG